MRIILLDLPVHIPTVMPYSLTMMKAVLSSCLDEEIISLDLNAKYHFDEYHEFYERLGKEEDFFILLDEFENSARLKYQKISKAALEKTLLPGYSNILNQILSEKPDVVGISLTYNSQIFFCDAIIKELNEKGIKVVIGGPADHSKLTSKAIILPDYTSFIDYLKSIGAKEFNEMKKPELDFSQYKKEYYFTKDLIYPIRTAISCPYKRCTFCTHHGNANYSMMDLQFIKETIVNNKIKKICFIDDDFPVLRLKELIAILSPLDVTWWCQLRPLKALIPLIPDLYKSGLRSVVWGVESGSQRVLDLMQKGTKIEDVEAVLEASKKAGIRNVTYIMFGLPGETKEEFMRTIDFLERNAGNIDLVSLSVFGLQKGSRIFAEPDVFGVEKVILTKRTFLDDKIEYTPKSGLTQAQAKDLKIRNQYRINKINKVPRILNASREQILNL